MYFYKRFSILLVFLLLLTSCNPSVPPATEPGLTNQPEPATDSGPQESETAVLGTEAPDPITQRLNSMTLEEQVGQLFLVRCPESDGVGVISTYQPGGILLFGRDFDDQTPETLRETLASYQEAAKQPLLIAVDEEGGTVCRVSSHSAFRKERFPAPRELYAQGGLEAVQAAEAEKSTLLHSLGINVNLSPVCDITTNPDSFLYQRSLGQSPEITAEFVQATVQTMSEGGIGSVLKHFPGYGDNCDTHTGTATDDRSYETYVSSDFIPFRAGIEAGSGCVLVSHNTVLSMDKTDPASLSPEVHRILREELGFQGVILTDDLAMDAISHVFEEGEAAVLAVQAGNDLLCVSRIAVAYQAVLDAVEDGTLSPARITESVHRILTWKQSLGLLD